MASSSAIPRDSRATALAGNSNDRHASASVDNASYQFDRGEPQIREGDEQPMLADEQCLYHCIAAAANVQCYAALGLAEKIQTAYRVKRDFLMLLRSEGKYDIAARLGGTGPDSYPTMDEFEHLSIEIC